MTEALGLRRRIGPRQPHRGFCRRASAALAQLCRCWRASTGRSAGAAVLALAWGVLLRAARSVGSDPVGCCLAPLPCAGRAGVITTSVDADLRSEGARTAARPGGERRCEQEGGVGWLLALCLVGLVVLLQLHLPAAGSGAGEPRLVAAYPFMKRNHWWPRPGSAWCSAGGALVAWTELRGDQWQVLAALYAGAICWVIGYDTIVCPAGPGGRCAGRHPFQRPPAGVAMCRGGVPVLAGGAGLVGAGLLAGAAGLGGAGGAAAGWLRISAGRC